MERDFQTPSKNSKKNNLLRIPPSPQMKKIGFGTGISVYELQRSPLPDKLRSPWAIKKILQNVKNKPIAKSVNKRVEVEAEILRKLNHPNIVGFRALLKDKDGTSILAMEECTSSLGDLIENRLEEFGNVPFSPKTILKVCHDIANALDYLHNTTLLLHCDVKSYNVLVKGDFVVCKLCDFGVCLPLTKSGELDLIKTHGIKEYEGTCCWCPHEVLKEDPEITTKADIYSYGLMIWEMLALVPPITDEPTDEDSFTDDLSFEVKNKGRPDLPDVELGPEYNFILEIYFCCTMFEKEKRPSASDLVQILDKVVKNNCTNIDDN